MTWQSRWQAAIAVLVALALTAALPDRLTLGPYWVAVLPALVLLLPLLLLGRRMNVRLNRTLSVALIAILNFFNLASVLLLIGHLIGPAHVKQPLTAFDLLRSGSLIWLENVIVFSLWFWEIDRETGFPDFLFPQVALKDTSPNCVPRGWTPLYLDYLYLSFTNALAFSPTDVMPLTRLAKMLMLIESLISFVTVALIVARSINILS